jgi:hypothetical protein
MARTPSWLNEVEVDKIPVQVIGWGDEGVAGFPNLAAAREKHPELDPYSNSAKFTWAMRGEMNGKPALRFETWEAYKHYSA